MTTKPIEPLTSETEREFIRKWLTGDDEFDARVLRRSFKGLRFSIGQWRQIIAESKEVAE